MIRQIIGFRSDDAGHWVAELSCGHAQHVRHRPPLQDRPWVLEPEGRAGRVGSPLGCPPCDRAELPTGLVARGSAGPWDADGIPAGLRRSHRTPEGRWGLLRVHEGTVDFAVETGAGEPGEVVHLSAGAAQPIPPGVPHRVVPRGRVRLELELWGPPQPSSAMRTSSRGF